jgi:RNA 3'-phosphate cyclase
MLEIDGSFSDSSDQILKTSGVLSVVTKKPFHIFNIRKSDSNSDLGDHGLTNLKALAYLCNGRIEEKKEELTFFPGEIEKGKDNIGINLPAATSIPFFLKNLIVIAPSLKNEITIEIEGGATDTFFSQTMDYFNHCFLNLIETIGIKTEIEVLKRGYYPQGGSKVKLKIYPSEIKEINLTERGNLNKIIIISGASKFLEEKKVAQRQVAGTKEIIGKLKLPTEEKINYYQSESPGSHICLIGDFEKTKIGSYSLGKLGKRAEDVGKEAAINLLEEEKTKTCIDKNSLDQVLIYMALSNKKATINAPKINNRSKTNIWIIKKFIPGEFEIKEPKITWVPKK